MYVLLLSLCSNKPRHHHLRFGIIQRWLFLLHPVCACHTRTTGPSLFHLIVCFMAMFSREGGPKPPFPLQPRINHGDSDCTKQKLRTHRVHTNVINSGFHCRHTSLPVQCIDATRRCPPIAT